MNSDESFESLPGAPAAGAYRAEYSRRGPRPVARDLHVDLTQAWEVHLWTRHFDCSETELRRAVEAAGNRAQEVRAYLRRHRG